MSRPFILGGDREPGRLTHHMELGERLGLRAGRITLVLSGVRQGVMLERGIIADFGEDDPGFSEPLDQLTRMHRPITLDHGDSLTLCRKGLTVYGPKGAPDTVAMREFIDTPLGLAIKHDDMMSNVRHLQLAVGPSEAAQAMLTIRDLGSTNGVGVYPNYG
jgi:hypothetical protein